MSKRYQQQSCIQAKARRSRYDDDYVEYDDEDSWSNQARRSSGLVPSIAAPLLMAANTFSVKVTDIVIDLVPSNIERATVEIAVKAGLVLVAVGVVRGLLGIAFTVGTVLFGLYVATKIWGKQDAQDPSGSRNQMQQRRRQQRRRQDDDGLSDVWFESKPQRKNTKKTQDDDFW